MCNSCFRLPAELMLGTLGGLENAGPRPGGSEKGNVV